MFSFICDRELKDYVRKEKGVAEVNWTIACGSEIKYDAAFWRHAQISPANFETK